VKSAPPPPHSVGMHTPNSPSAPMRRTVSSGTVAVRSQSAANGATSFWTNSRVISRMAICSLVGCAMAAPQRAAGPAAPPAAGPRTVTPVHCS